VLRQLVSADETIVDVLAGWKDNEFSMVVDAINKSGLADTLRGRQIHFYSFYFKKFFFQNFFSDTHNYV
jgi:hypothetical protein